MNKFYLLLAFLIVSCQPIRKGSLHAFRFLNDFDNQVPKLVNSSEELNLKLTQYILENISDLPSAIEIGQTTYYELNLKEENYNVGLTRSVHIDGSFSIDRMENIYVEKDGLYIIKSSNMEFDLQEYWNGELIFSEEGENDKIADYNIGEKDEIVLKPYEDYLFFISTAKSRNDDELKDYSTILEYEYVEGDNVDFEKGQEVKVKLKQKSVYDFKDNLAEALKDAIVERFELMIQEGRNRNVISNKRQFLFNLEVVVDDFENRPLRIENGIISVKENDLNCSYVGDIYEVFIQD